MNSVLPLNFLGIKLSLPLGNNAKLVVPSTIFPSESFLFASRMSSVCTSLKSLKDLPKSFGSNPIRFIFMSDFSTLCSPSFLSLTIVLKANDSSSVTSGGGESFSKFMLMPAVPPMNGVLGAPVLAAPVFLQAESRRTRHTSNARR